MGKWSSSSCVNSTLSMSLVTSPNMRDLEIEIVYLQRSAGSTGNRGCIEDLKSIKAILVDLLGSKTQGVLVRSRFQSAALMDSPSQNGQSRFIHTLHSDTGQILT